MGYFITFFSSLLFEGKPPVVALGWTLEWEMLFYVVFSASLFFRSWKLVIFSVATTLILVSALTGNLIVLEFLLGVFVAFIFHRKKYTVKFGLILFIFGFVLLLLSLFPYVQEQKLNRFFIWGIPAFFMLAGSIYSVQIKSTILSYLGNASYSIYLIQMLTIPAFYRLFSKLLIGINNDLLAILCLIFSVFTGCIFYSLVEKPTTIYLRKIYRY